MFNKELSSMCILYAYTWFIDVISVSMKVIMELLMAKAISGGAGFGAKLWIIHVPIWSSS